MNHNGFERQIEAARQRLEALERRAGASPAQTEALSPALQELSTSLEELHAAAEELRAQSDELNATHHALELERRRYLDLFDFAPDGYLVTDGQATIRQANQAAAAMLGVGQEPLVGKPLVVFVPEPERRAFRGQLAALTQNGSTQVQGWDIILQPRKGAPFPAAVRVGVVHDDHGQLTHLRWLLRDISERKQQEEAIQRLNQELRRRIAELATSNREIESLSDSVSRDLRAPLRRIVSFTEVVLEDHAAALGAEGQDSLHRVQHAAREMGALLDALLRLSQLVRSDMMYQTVNLSSLARTVATEIQEANPTRRATWIIQEGIEVDGDRRLLRVVLENLLGNAWKFSARQSDARIEFGCLQEAQERVYFVRDNGVGFDKARSGRLFHPFQRLHSAEDFEGIGIGLTAVQRIIQRHGGRIWGDGNVAQGATFSFTLQPEGRTDRRLAVLSQP